MPINDLAIHWSLRELEVFTTLAETLNYRRAAERLHLSQPAVSGVIARLEAALGARLFDRSTRAVALTAAGGAWLPEVRLLRQQAATAAQAVRDVVERRAGQVRVAALPSLAASAVPGAFARFAAQHPGVRLQVLDTLSGPAFDLVRAGQVDLALTAANPDYADLAYTPLVSDAFVLLLPAGHALAAGRGPLRWADVAALPHISMPRPTSVRQYAEAALLQQGLRFEPRYEVEHLATITAMVAAGLGVAALPELAALVARSAQVVQRPLAAPVQRRPIGLVTRQGASLSPAAQAMVALLRDEVQRLVTVPAGPSTTADDAGAATVSPAAARRSPARRSR
jgi:DNA-binding transcriptional LysR family regulator